MAVREPVPQSAPELGHQNGSVTNQFKLLAIPA